MRATITLEIDGLGIIFYSPAKANHIVRGEDYLEAHFWEPEDIARHVNMCEISAFGTGSSGLFILKLYDAPLDVARLEAADASGRLGIEVVDRRLCFRDLYDLMEWEPECPKAQCVDLPNGFYRITAYTSVPASGIIGDEQTIHLHFEAWPERPRLAWTGVPDLFPDESED